MKTGLRSTALAAFISISATFPAMAEFAKVTERDQFVQLIDGKTLSRPLVRLTVSPEGGIDGNGAGWGVDGSWSWQNGYFCREIFWGGDPLGYNCQEVKVSDREIRFTSDKGTGQSADFRLR